MGGAVKGGKERLNPPQFPFWEGPLIEFSLPAVEFKCQVLFIFSVKDPHSFYLG